MERRYRLRGRARFLEVHERGQRWFHPLAMLGGLPNGLEYTRCGFIVSRKLGGAVERNRVRRRLREAVRLLYQQIRPGWDLVWVARPPSARADFTAISAAVGQLLGRAGLYLPPEEEGHA